MTGGPPLRLTKERPFDYRGVLVWRHVSAITIGVGEGSQVRETLAADISDGDRKVPPPPRARAAGSRIARGGRLHQGRARPSV
jgi:hypothetical protein